MTLTLLKSLPFLRRRPPESLDYSRLIVDHLQYIESQCRRAVSGQGGSRDGGDTDCENRVDELLTEVLDHLRADDFKVLREYQGGAKITTYLTAVIANLTVDLLRKRRGRSRARERAAEFGRLGEELYELVVVRGYTVAEAHGQLASGDRSRSFDEVRACVERIRGRSPEPSFTDAWPYQGKEVVTDDGLEIVIPDPAGTAEDLLAGHQQKSLCRRVLGEVLDVLSGEERLMLRLRFPPDEDEPPRTVREIAAIVGLSEKAVDNRLRRILVRCRELLLKRGVALDDLVGTG